MNVIQIITRRFIACLILSLLVAPAWSADVIKLGILKYGTANWELAAMRNLGIDRQHQIELEITPLASLSATKVALKSGAVDVIVTDWFWVNLQRSKGDALQLIPYSKSVGSLMVPSNSKISKISDLKDLRIGIAGGPLSKGWILMQSAAKKEGWNLAQSSHQSYGAPPLLSASLQRGQVDAALTYWHFAARLQASGLKPVLPLHDIQSSLGLKSEIPMLGYVFHETWATKNKTAVQNFAKAISLTKQALANNSENWEPLRPLMKAENPKTFEFLKQGYINGIPGPITAQQLDDAAKFFDLMKAASAEYQDSHFEANSFWQANAH